MLVDGDVSDAVGEDVAADGVLDFGDGTADGGLDVAGVLKGAVGGGVEGAVLEGEAVDVAEGLFACDMAADEAQVLAVPAEVLAVEVGVVDGDVLGFPEGIFGDDMGIADDGIADVLEDIFRVTLEAVDIDVLAEHEGVGAFVEAHVTDDEVADAPEGLVGIVHLHVLQGQAAHLAEELGGIDDAVAHDHIVAVPDGGTRADLEIAVGDERAVDVPPRVFADEAAAVGFEALAALDAALALGDGDVLEAGIVDGEEGALASEGLVFDEFHCCTCFDERFIVVWF